MTELLFYILPLTLVLLITTYCTGVDIKRKACPLSGQYKITAFDDTAIPARASLPQQNAINTPMTAVVEHQAVPKAAAATHEDSWRSAPVSAAATKQSAAAAKDQAGSGKGLADDATGGTDPLSQSADSSCPSMVSSCGHVNTMSFSNQCSNTAKGKKKSRLFYKFS